MTATDPASSAELRGEADRALWRLAESVPALLWVADDAGRWTYVNPRWRQFTGRQEDDHIGHGWIDDVHPDDRAAVLEAYARGVASGAGFEVEHRLITASGEHRWMLMRGAPRRAPDGVVLGHVGVVIDITEGRRTGEKLRASEDLLDTIVTCAPVGFALFDLEMRYLRVNVALAKINGIAAEDHIGRRPSDLLPADLSQRIGPHFRRVLDGGEAMADIEVSGSTPAAPGIERHWLTSWYPVRADGEIVAVGVFASEITSRVRAERGIGLLSDVGEALDATLGVDERLARLADLLVPALGDFCTIDTLGPDGEPHLVACAHSDPAGVALLQELRARTAADARSPLPVAQVMRTGLAEIFELSPPALDELVAESSSADLLRRLGPCAVMVLPIVVRGRVLGVLLLGTSTSGRVYDDDHLALGRQLARRAGLAVDNARLYDNERRIARTLQRSLLPPALPEIPGLDVAARFSPMGEGDDVGGDFYDVFIAGESWVAAIGDVCGKGAEAAAVTALARYTIRAAAARRRSPAEILRWVNEAMLAQGAPRFCTVAVAHIDRSGEGVRVSVALGGHPQPLMLRADRSVEAIGVPGTLLGLVDRVTVEDSTTDLGPGDTLLLFTDGVTEAGAPAQVWTPEDFEEALGRAAGLSAQGIVDHVAFAALAGRDSPFRDDVAMLALRALPAAPA